MPKPIGSDGSSFGVGGSSVPLTEIIKQTVAAPPAPASAGMGAGMGGSPSDPNANFTLPEMPTAAEFDFNGPLQARWMDGHRGPYSPHYQVQGGESGFTREVNNYFIIRQKRLDNLLGNLDAETAKMVKNGVQSGLAVLESGGIPSGDGKTTIPYASATPDQQLAARDAVYAEAEKAAIQNGGAIAGNKAEAESPTTSLGYTPQDLAALQAVASQYLVPYAQQAQASGGMAQASLQSLASQAATPQMRVYATQAANAQKAAQDQLAAAYMAQVSAAPTMAVIQQNTQLQQQMAQLQQQILGYQARSQQPSASTGMDPAAMTAAVQAPR